MSLRNTSYQVCDHYLHPSSEKRNGKESRQGTGINVLFGQAYPHITEWVTTHGWIEIGQIEGVMTFVMALDEGGVVWEGEKTYKTLDEAFQALEAGLLEWMEEQLF